MAHILFISRYYLPEKAAAAVCVSESAKRLVQLGHQVTVLTTVPNYPAGIVPHKYRGRVFQDEVLDGVRVVRVWSYIKANKGFLGRILSQLSFGCLAPFLGGKTIGRPDIIIVGSPPLFNVIAARMLARLKHCPFIFMVADLWPESAVQFGVLANPLLIKISEWLEWSTYQRASLVWVVSDGVRDLLIQRGLSAKQMFLIPNGVDTVRFRPLSKTQVRAEFSWDDRYTVLYAGTHGLAHGLQTILEAAEQLKHRGDIHFVLAGDGEEKEYLIAYAQAHNLQNVTFIDAQPYDKMPLLYASADLCVVSMRKVPLLATTIPVKMYEIMACGCPFILAGKGMACQIAEEAGAGLIVEPEDADALVSSLLYLREHPEEAERLGLRGRAYVEAHFDYAQLTAALNTRLDLLLELEKRAHASVEEISVLPKTVASTLSPVPETFIPVSGIAKERGGRVASE
jgi:colanic acid biosynthesis glycosyl transferase WcaI